MLLHHRFQLIFFHLLQPQIQEVAHDKRVQQVGDDKTPNVMPVFFVAEELGKQEGAPKQHPEYAAKTEKADKVGGFASLLVLTVLDEVHLRDHLKPVQNHIKHDNDILKRPTVIRLKRWEELLTQYTKHKLLNRQLRPPEVLGLRLLVFLFRADQDADTQPANGGNHDVGN